MLWPGVSATRRGSCGYFSRHCQVILAEIHVTDRPHLYKSLYHPPTVAVRRNTNVMPKAGYYAVKVGKRPGIYTTWEDCREQVDGYPCATYKKLRTVEEAEAWMRGGASQSGPVEHRGVPYPVKPRIKPVSHSRDQARASIGSQPSGHVPVSSTVKPMPTVRSDSKLQPTSGLSSAMSRNVAGLSRVTSSAAGEDVVYTDGACAGNGQHGSVAGIGVWWGPIDTRNLSERCPGRQTNNRAELIAIIRALETSPITSMPLVIKSDSEYAIKCISPCCCTAPTYRVRRLYGLASWLAPP